MRKLCPQGGPFLRLRGWLFAVELLLGTDGRSSAAGRRTVRMGRCRGESLARTEANYRRRVF